MTTNEWLELLLKKARRVIAVNHDAGLYGTVKLAAETIAMEDLLITIEDIDEWKVNNG